MEHLLTLSSQQHLTEREGLGRFVRERHLTWCPSEQRVKEELLASIQHHIDLYLKEHVALTAILVDNIGRLCDALSSEMNRAETYSRYLAYLTEKYYRDIMVSTSNEDLCNAIDNGCDGVLPGNPIVIVSAHYGLYLSLISSLAQHRRLVLLRSYRIRDAVIEGVVRRLEASKGILRTNSLGEATERLERGWSVVVFPDTTHFFREERNIRVNVGPLALGFLRGFADLLSRVGVAPMFAARGWRDNTVVNVQEQGEASSHAEEHAAQYGAFLMKLLQTALFQWDRIIQFDQSCLTDNPA